MRTKLLLTTALLMSVSGLGVEAISASTDCDKWLREYKQQLAESQPVKKVLAVKHVRGRVHPRSHAVRPYSPVHHIRTPKLSPQEMLRRFHILCGELPSDNEMALLPLDPMAEMIVPRSIEFPHTAGPTPDASLPPTLERTPAQPPANFTPPVSFIPPSTFVPSIPRSPLTPSTPVGPLPGNDLPPTSPITPVAPPVPEPNSLVLLLTGFAGIFALGLRKITG